MKKFNLDDKYENPIYLCLGFFDCIHTGHKELIKQSIYYSKKQNQIETAVLTFSNDPNVIFNSEKQIYSITERSYVIEKLGVDNLITVEFNNDFSKLTPNDFLDKITNNFNVKAIFVGSDYTYGYKAEGDVDSLYAYCRNKNIDLIVIPFVLINDLKLSTRDLKKYIIDGNVDLYNQFVTEPYFILGNVTHGKQNGNKLGFPTINIIDNKEKLTLSKGVYATIVEFENNKYLSMTNVGTKPTFNDNVLTIETNIFNFNKEIYGKDIKLSFIEKLRETKKFDSLDLLKEQLEKDKEITKIILAGKI